MNGQPEIPAGDLLLRPWRSGDAAALVRAWADPEIRRWGRYGAAVPETDTVGQWLDWNRRQWEFGLRVGFAVCRGARDGGGVVGSILLRDFARTATHVGHIGDTGEVGYWIVPGWRGRGAATSALAAVTRWAFTAADDGGLGLSRIELRHSVGNPGSCRVAAKAGYRHEATMRESFRYADGARHDEHLHARLAGEDDEIREARGHDGADGPG
ncbi:MAG TPA: GNAT family protein [Actinospica sp.]|nr:GNAT family protein [Actinospica sp.]